MRMTDEIQTDASLENLRMNLEMKSFAREVLTEKNYGRFLKSYRFTFWFQLLGIIGGFLVPSIVLLILFRDTAFLLFAMTIGIIWMTLWLIVSQLIPPTRIYRKFAKWYRRKDASIRDLEEIFYR